MLNMGIGYERHTSINHRKVYFSLKALVTYRDTQRQFRFPILIAMYPCGAVKPQIA